MTREERQWLREMPLSRRHPNRIRVAACLEGLTLRELGSKIGLSRWTVSRICAGETRKVAPEKLQVIAGILGVSLDDLFADGPDPGERLAELPPK